MDKLEHGKRLKKAIAGSGLSRDAIAAATGFGVRTVTNWTSGKTEPSEAEKVVLRRIVGEYDSAGDPVEVAVRQSELIEWRRDAVVAFYKRNLHEQAQERGA